MKCQSLEIVIEQVRVKLSSPIDVWNVQVKDGGVNPVQIGGIKVCHEAVCANPADTNITHINHIGQSHIPSLQHSLSQHGINTSTHIYVFMYTILSPITNLLSYCRLRWSYFSQGYLNIGLMGHSYFSSPYSCGVFRQHRHLVFSVRTQSKMSRQDSCQFRFH